MAKSIYDVLNDLTTETSVPAIKDKDGNIVRKNYGDVEHTIPRNLLPTAEQFEDESDLVDWATDNDCLHAMLQKGIQKSLIEIRATFKGCKKDDIWSEDYGQNNVDMMEWKIVQRPNAGSTKKLDEARFADCMAMIVNLTEAKMPVDTIKTMTVGIYGEDIVNSIFDTLTD